MSTEKAPAPSDPLSRKRLNRLIVIGAGGLGREVAHLARHVGKDRFERDWRFAGFLDDRTQLLEGTTTHRRILGRVGEFRPRPRDRFLCAVGNPIERLRYAGVVRSQGGQFINLIASEALVVLRNRMGTGVIIGPFAIVSCDVTIGDDVHVQGHGTVGHDVVLGDGCHVGAYVFLGGGCRIGRGALLHPHATVLPGITVGDGAVVGAGSVVTQPVAAGETVFGVPAQRVRS